MQDIITYKLISLCPETWLGVSKQLTKLSTTLLSQREFPTDNIAFWRTIRLLYAYGGMPDIVKLISANNDTIYCRLDHEPCNDKKILGFYSDDELEYAVKTLIKIPHCPEISLQSTSVANIGRASTASLTHNLRIWRHLAMRFTIWNICSVKNLFRGDGVKILRLIEVICIHYPYLITYSTKAISETYGDYRNTWVTIKLMLQLTDAKYPNLVDYYVREELLERGKHVD